RKGVSLGPVHAAESTALPRARPTGGPSGGQKKERGTLLEDPGHPRYDRRDRGWTRPGTVGGRELLQWPGIGHGGHHPGREGRRGLCGLGPGPWGGERGPGPARLGG